MGYLTGNYDAAIADYDNAVRLCPNYETDFMDANFVFGGENAVEVAIELLNSVVSDPPESAADYYYTGVRQLFINDGFTAQLCFEKALELGYSDGAKVKQHLENLEKRT